MNQESAAAAGFEKCQRLLKNPEVEWLLAEAIGAPRLKAEATLRDLQTSKDARENAAHVLDALETAEKFLQKQSDTYERQLPKTK